MHTGSLFLDFSDAWSGPELREASTTSSDCGRSHPGPTSPSGNRYQPGCPTETLVVVVEEGVDYVTEAVSMPRHGGAVGPIKIRESGVVMTR